MRRESDTLRPGAKAPDFTLADTHGVPHRLAELLSGAGTKVPAYEYEVPAHEYEVPAHDLLLVFDRGTW